MLPGRSIAQGAFKSRLIVCLFLGVAAALVSFTGMQYIQTPKLYPGDELEERDCRICGGSGVDEQMAMDYPEMGSRCHFCGGGGKVQVIIPGPNRPTRIWGAVVSQARTGDLYKKSFRYDPPMGLRVVTPLPGMVAPGSEIEGGLGDARVVFRSSSGETLQLESSSSGRFSKRLSPGEYAVHVTAAGHEPVDGKLKILPLETPIWVEKATLIEPPESVEHAQSQFGVQMLVVMREEGKRGGEVRVYGGF